MDELLGDGDGLAAALGDDEPDGEGLALGEPEGALLPDGLDVGVGCGSPDGLDSGEGDGLTGTGDASGLGARVGVARLTNVSDAAAGLG